MLVFSNLLRVTSSLDDIPKVRRPCSLLCYFLLNIDKACVKCLSRKKKKTQLKLCFSCPLPLVRGKKPSWTSRDVGVKTCKSSRIFCFLILQILQDLTPETKLQFDLITSGGRVGSVACRGHHVVPSSVPAHSECGKLEV